MHQIIKLVESDETENSVDDLVQVQAHHAAAAELQQKPQYQVVEVKRSRSFSKFKSAQPQAPHQQLMSSDSPNKMVDIYEQHAKFEPSMIREIEGQNFEKDSDHKYTYKCRYWYLIFYNFQCS